MNDRKSGLYIDAFQVPSDRDIKKKWDLWKKTNDNPCQESAIKWLRCMSVFKDLYELQGGDVNNGEKWHKFMLDKCYVPYTDYHGCRIEERDKDLQRLRAQIGEEKHLESVEKAKAVLAQKVGEEAAAKIFRSLTKSSNAERFKELRNAIDEERGVIRDGMEIPDFDKKPSLSSDATRVKPVEKTQIVDESSKSWFRGWWSDPESRFKKGNDSQQDN